MVTRSFKTALGALSAAALLAACGTQEVNLDAADSDPDSRIRQGAQIFADKCSGCHTLDSAGAQGSATDIRDRERTDGPSFDTRAEEVEAVLYAIRNGGFSGAIMPENIVVGDEAQKVAEYLAKYAGRDIDDRETGGRTREPEIDEDGPDETGGGSGESTTTNPGRLPGSIDQNNPGGGG